MISNFIKSISIWIFLGVTTITGGQAQNQNSDDRKYIGADSLGIGGRQAHSGPSFHRIDTSRYPDLPPNPKLFYTHSAGMYISFRTNSSSIYAKWCTSSAKAYMNMTGIAFEGLDLYIKKDGAWVYAGVGRLGTGDCNEHTLVTAMEEGVWKECLLYLPLYDAISSLEIGVNTDAKIHPLENKPFNKQIPIYGTSIVQGASASRPGLAYPARMSRLLGHDFINLGISGSAKMEPEVAHMIANMELDGLILDCIPNCSPDNISDRTASFIQIIRKKHPQIPIIAMEGAAFESGNFNRIIADDMEERNRRWNIEINLLKKSDPNLYLIESEGLMGDDHEGTIDGTHPNDLGFDRMLNKMVPATKNILDQYTFYK
ncbi:MAG TPA: SGNH/GDSL hydrolase family protein [Sphingobacteriaceae bacterium]|nr:SGNH/GDSL hydrolase family protein [Sphingobacteriaceae bacterium]